MQISAIVPVVDEAERLPAVVGCLRRLEGVAEVIVVDGGSVDASREVAARCGARVIESARRQRAAQLNLGADRARSEVLLFVHADTLMPAGAGRSIRRALSRDRRILGGHFRRRFVGGHPVLGFTSRLADLRARYWGVSFGDQAQFVRRAAFEAVGGFRDCRCAEDMDLARRLWRRGHTVTIGPPIRTSARRFGRRPVAMVLRDGWLTLCYAFVSPCARSRACD